MIICDTTSSTTQPIECTRSNTLNNNTDIDSITHALDPACVRALRGAGAGVRTRGHVAPQAPPSRNHFAATQRPLPNYFSKKLKIRIGSQRIGSQRIGS